MFFKKNNNNDFFFFAHLDTASGNIKRVIFLEDFI